MTAFFNRRAGLTLAALAALGLASTAAQAQAVFTSWTFNNGTIGATSSPATALGTGTASTLGMTNTYGTPGPSVDISDILVQTGTSTSLGTINPSDQSWRVRGGEPTGGTSAANGWSSLAPIYTQGAQFLTSTAGEQNISLTFDWAPTAQGVGDLELQYTTDGKAFQNAALFTDIATASVPAVANEDGLTFSFGTAANNDPNFGVRLVSTVDPASGKYLSTLGTPLNNTSGNWRFDNVNFSGTPAPVPEASTPVSLGLLLALGLAGLVVAAKRKKASA